MSRRSEARAKGDYELADIFRNAIDEISQNSSCSVRIPKGYQIQITDAPRVQGGGSTWSLQPCISVENGSVEGATNSRQKNTGSLDDASVLELAHFALGLATSSSDKGIALDYTRLNDIVLRAKRRLYETGEEDLRGRKAADAAFWFALSGVKEDHVVGAAEGLNFSLFDALTYICLRELERCGRRSSFRVMDIMHIVERIAASGISSEVFTRFQQEAASCLETKPASDINALVERGIIDDLHQGKFEFHSERSLLWIWRFSTRQRKQRSFLKSASEHYESKEGCTEESNTKLKFLHNNKVNCRPWSDIFEDPNRPLVVDIGCGMGVSILGLSKFDVMDSKEDELLNLDWCNSNFLGVDLSYLGINFASALSERLDSKKNVYFDVIPAEDAMEWIAETYPGKVRLCMIQFPTPFRFNEGKEIDSKEMPQQSVVNQGNQQLPNDAFNGFMVTRNLLQLTCKALDEVHGRLLLQSNVEDVAVFMKELAIEYGFEVLPARKSVNDIKHELNNPSPQRTQKWVTLGGDRAIGKEWSSESFLTSRGATETEVACLFNGTPIHRVLLKPHV